MKKWLIRCLTVLAMVCLIPGIVLKAAAETVPVYCSRCGIREEREVRRYEKYDSTYHKVCVDACQSCHNDGNVTLLQVHTGGTETPTCTTGKTCEKCGAEYDIPGHDWGAWTPNYDGTNTHTRRCTRSNCDAKETAPCSGGYAACDSLGMCETCGGSYYGGHAWGKWSSAGNGTHIRSCMNYCSEVDTASCFGGTATCTAKAVCEACGGEYGEKDPNNHDLVQHAAKAPTCTEIGWDAYDRCIRCGYTTRKELPALNHDLVRHVAQAPTCTEKGWAYDTCSRSGCNYTTRKELPALNHDLKQYAAKAPTCTEIGWDAYEACSRCDYTTRKELPALKHDLVYYKAKDPTCTEPGCDAYETCSRCDYTTYVERPALKHDLRQRVIKAPTCTQMGWAYETCSRCDYFATPLLPALNHDLEQHAAKAPTCTEIGWDAYEACSRCDYTTYAELPALNHDLEQHAAKAPTCTEIGWNAYETCSRCDYTTYAELPALNHDLVNHDAKAPTCTEIGWDAYKTCSRCNYTTYAEQPALNHALVQHAAKAPTCTEIGWDTYDRCIRCGYTTRKELPALNHDLVRHVAQAPTCTEKGWAYDTCSRCDYTTYAELPALNHDYQAVTVEPTCETDGYTIFTCSRCKDSYTADPTDQLGHQFGAWSPNGTGSQSADCLRQGCAHTGSTDCRKFTFRTAEGEALTFCPVCGQAENAAQLEKIEAATAWANSGSLSAEDVTARMNGEYLSVAFETAGSLTQPTGRVRLALPAGLLEGKKLVRIAPDGTQAEMPFETERGKLIYTLDFANSELPVMLFRLVPQTTAL